MSVDEYATAYPGPDGHVRLDATRRSRREQGPGGSRSPRFYGRVVAALLLPGSGLLGTRWRAAGALIVVAFLGGVGWCVWQLTSGGLIRRVLGLALSADTLRIVGAVLAVGAVLWVGTIVLTAEMWWPRRRRGRYTRAAFTILMCAFVAVPSAAGVRYAGVQAALLQDVVAGGSGTAAGGDNPWRDIPRVNVLLIGSDAGDNRVGVRTDSMMVVSTDTRTGDTLLIGIPRNLENVPFPEGNPLRAEFPNGYDCGDECLMNGVWTLATERADLFPGDSQPGLTTTVDVAGEITGLDIDRSIVVDLAGFRSLVDAMGGVDINVRERVCVSCKSGSDGSIRWNTDKREWIEPGPQRLDGRLALWYARSRAGSDDFNRMRRQRCVAGALIQQADPVSLLARYLQIADAIRKNVQVSLPDGELQAWADLVTRIQQGNSIRSLPLTARVVEPANPDFDKIRVLVDSSLTPPVPQPSSPAAPTPSTPSVRPTPTTPDESPSPSPSDPADDSALNLSQTC